MYKNVKNKKDALRVFLFCKLIHHIAEKAVAVDEIDISHFFLYDFIADRAVIGGKNG